METYTHDLKVGDRVSAEDFIPHGQNEPMGKGTITVITGPYIWNDVWVRLDGDEYDTPAIAGCCKKLILS